MADKLEEIVGDFFAAQNARDSAMELLDEAHRALKTADTLYDRAVEALAEYVGLSDEVIGETEGGFGIGGLTSAMKTINKYTGAQGIQSLFGDLF